ncbi:MAG TPA: universal stress protein, partial [Nitrososphaera sp.]|nr:universal stress protein [Nitrososphaera sp.]
MNNRILIPYDGSKYSDKAARTAIDHIRSLSRRPEKIILLHVVSKIHLPPSLDYGMHMPNVKTTKQYRKELYQQMKGQASHILEAKKQEF